MSIIIREANDRDREWIRNLIIEHWGSECIVTRGKLYYVDQLHGIIAENRNKRVGLLTYRFEQNECEIMSLNSLRERQGVGTALMKSVQDIAKAAGCSRIWLITTNDNTHAMRFYEKLGYHRVKIYYDAIEISRKLKPEIPEIGIDGIPIRDEIEYEIIL
jgi:ribosomal protein S18 acetylase RimI-like enzyme